MVGDRLREQIAGSSQEPFMNLIRTKLDAQKSCEREAHKMSYISRNA